MMAEFGVKVKLFARLCPEIENDQNHLYRRRIFNDLLDKHNSRPCFLTFLSSLNECLTASVSVRLKVHFIEWLCNKRTALNIIVCKIGE